MLRQALMPITVSHSAPITACGQDEEIRRAFGVCVTMQRQTLQPDMVSYRALISAREQGEELRWAYDVKK